MKMENSSEESFQRAVSDTPMHVPLTESPGCPLQLHRNVPPEVPGAWGTWQTGG